MSDTIYLVDAYSQIYRGYYAVPGLATGDGRPSNAIFATGRFLVTLEKEYAPRAGAFAFDLGAPAHRLALAPAYKAQRPEMPSELKSQLSVIRELIAAAGWPILDQEGFEADDIIASIVKTFSGDKFQIISNDKDLAQVIDERVSMLVQNPKGGKFSVRGPTEVVEKFGVPTTLIIDYLAMVGDSSDNIPGIDGVGPKTAAKLLAEFGSINGILERAAEIKNDSLREKITTAGDLLRKNQQLITLRSDLTSAAWNSPDKLRLAPPNLDRLRQIATDYELRSLVKEFETVFSNHASPTQGTFLL